MRRKTLAITASCLMILFLSAGFIPHQKPDNELVTKNEDADYSVDIHIVGSGTVTPESGNYSGFIELEAIPDKGYKFAGWGRDLGGTINLMPLVVGSDKQIIANFVKADAPLHSINVTVEGSGFILNKHPRAYKGSEVVLTAISREGYKFAGWQGDITASTNVVSVQIDGDMEIKALFLPFSSAVYYVSADGDDLNPGTFEEPFKNIDKALSVLKADGIAYVMPGVYNSDNNDLSDRSGEPGAPIHIVAYDLNDKPVITTEMSVERCSYLHLRGFEITVSGFETNGIDAHHNIFENMDVHHVVNSQVAFNMNHLTHDNLLVNCDFHNNVLHAGSNADGIAMWGVNGTTNGPYNNTLIGCRSYFNNDDGFDIWWSGSNTRFEECWAYGNGRDSAYNDIEGDGNGFKLGQGKGSAVLINCMTWKNRNTGFDQNSNTGGGLSIFNCTAYDNTYHDIDFWESPATSMIRNCISYKGRVHTDAADDQYNSWNMDQLTISDDDFISLDFSANMGERRQDGSLPESDFLRIRSGSGLNDAGTDVGLPFTGVAPDLGAYESEADSTLAVQKFEARSYGLRCYPNPFKDSMTLSYELDQDATVQLTVLNSTGQVVSVLVNSMQTGGIHHIQWNGTNGAGNIVPGGIYMTTLVVDQYVEASQFIVSR